MSFDNAYESLTEENDPRWAFGGGFADPLEGVDTTLPAGVDGTDLATYCLMLGDDALIMSHRLQQWCTNLPELEEEVAVANIALDLLGQARLLYARAAAADGNGHDEDHYAYFREERGFRNVRLVEAAAAGFGALIARLLLFATWRLTLLHRLVDSGDPVLSAMATKSVKEVTYHRDYAAQWLVRLGDGTELSHARAQSALTQVWPLISELFTPHPIEARLATDGVAVDPATLREEFDAVLDEVLAVATLHRPQTPGLAGMARKSGRDGIHTEELGFALAELQSVARAHPAATW
jgi:ring-1,2-phenylacetyl-CoA epoxidase subunit PaaC